MTRRSSEAREGIREGMRATFPHPRRVAGMKRQPFAASSGRDSSFWSNVQDQRLEIKF